MREIGLAKGTATNGPACEFHVILVFEKLTKYVIRWIAITGPEEMSFGTIFHDNFHKFIEFLVLVSHCEMRN